VYVPDPTLWPARIAAVKTRIRSRLSYGNLVRPDGVTIEFADEEGLPHGSFSDVSTAARGDEDVRVRWAEIEFLVHSACWEMEADGELMRTDGGGLQAFGLLAARLGWDAPNTLGPLAANYRGAIKGAVAVRDEWVPVDLRWPNVLELLRQAQGAYRGGLDVAAAVTARVAVEEAVRSALIDLEGDPRDDLRAAPREEHLFSEALTNPAGFTPLDRSAAVSAMSALRDRGNRAAHDGSVAHASLQEALMLLLPQALVSLSNAVGAPRRVRGL
jgi:hypothetical protein